MEHIEPTAPTTQISTPAATQKHNSKPLLVLCIIFILLLIPVSAMIGFYAGQQYGNGLYQQTLNENFQKPESQMKQLTVTVNPQIKETNTRQEITQGDTKIVKTPECGLSFTLPVREPLADGRYWQAPIGGSSPDLLQLVYPPLSDSMTKELSIMHVADGEASGYIDSAVIATCANIRQNITLNSEIITAIQRNISDYNEATFEKGMRPEKYTMTYSPTKKWGKDVMFVTLSDEKRDFPSRDYYTFIHKGSIYEIKAFGETTNPQVKKEQQAILDSMIFTD
jgi:hypothetical protein